MKKEFENSSKSRFLEQKTQLNWNDFYSFKLNLDSMQWHLSKLKKNTSHFYVCLHRNRYHVIELTSIPYMDHRGIIFLYFINSY